MNFRQEKEDLIAEGLDLKVRYILTEGASDLAVRLLHSIARLPVDASQVIEL